MNNSASFFNAVEAVNLENIQAFLRVSKRFPSIEVDSDGLALLHHASIKGYKDIVEYLIGEGASVDRLTNDALTPLYYAVKEGHLDIARILLDSGANIDKVVDSDGFTIFGLAINRGHTEMVELLLERGADKDNSKVFKGFTPLTLALSSGLKASEVLESLLSKGADYWKLNEDGTTCLFYAVNKPVVGVKNQGLKRLLEHVRDKEKWVDVKRFVRYIEPESGKSALCWACESANFRAVNSLFNHGADYKTVDLVQQKQLMEQETNDEKRDRFDRIEQMLSKQKQRDLDGWKDIHVAACYGRIEEFEDLLRQGVDIRMKTNKGLTVLHTAAIGGRNEIIQELLKRDFNVDDQDDDGKTALHYAAENRYMNATVEVLLDNGANINLKTSDGLTPLGVASRQSKNTCNVLTLVKRGALPDMMDGDGRLAGDLDTNGKIISYLRNARERSRRWLN